MKRKQFSSKQNGNKKNSILSVLIDKSRYRIKEPSKPEITDFFIAMVYEVCRPCPGGLKIAFYVKKQ